MEPGEGVGQFSIEVAQTLLHHGEILGKQVDEAEAQAVEIEVEGRRRGAGEGADPRGHGRRLCGLRMRGEHHLSTGQILRREMRFQMDMQIAGLGKVPDYRK